MQPHLLRCRASLPAGQVRRECDCSLNRKLIYLPVCPMYTFPHDSGISNISFLVHGTNSSLCLVLHLLYSLAFGSVHERSTPSILGAVKDKFKLYHLPIFFTLSELPRTQSLITGLAHLFLSLLATGCLSFLSGASATERSSGRRHAATLRRAVWAKKLFSTWCVQDSL